MMGFFRRRAERTRPDDPEAQLSLGLDAAPRTADELLARLTALGLTGITRCRLTRNRTVMVSFRGAELRVHEGYLGAPPEVLRAIVTFVRGRTRAQRAAAQQVILAHHVERPAQAARRGERTLPDDEPLAATLTEWHARFNTIHFGGRLREVPVRVSRRLKSRLGHYSAASPAGDTAEIVISRGHIRRHGWPEALHTLLHEMVHQWQDESGHPIDHGRIFRAKAREVGVTPAARRALTPGSQVPHQLRVDVARAAASELPHHPAPRRRTQ
jgi:hypothetical protein